MTHRGSEFIGGGEEGGGAGAHVCSSISHFPKNQGHIWKTKMSRRAKRDGIHF